MVSRFDKFTASIRDSVVFFKTYSDKDKVTYNKVYGKGQFASLLICIKMLAKDFFFLFTNPAEKSKGSDDYLLFVNSRNSYSSLAFLEAGGSIIYFDDSVSGTKYHYIDNGINIKYKFSFFYDLIFPLLYLKLLFTTKFKRFYVKNIHLIFLSYRVYISGINYFKKKKGTKVILSNDINVECRCVNYIAKEIYNLKTVYLQHANVSEMFPALNFSLALLYGEDAEMKYKQKGVNDTEILRVGIPKMQHHNIRKEICRVKTIGIAFNKIDGIDKLLYWAAELRKAGFELVVRPHPADVNCNIEEFKSLGCKISPFNESAIAYLEKIDFLIATDSSIHLEAISANIESAYICVNNLGFCDYYGFVKNQMIKQFFSPQEILTYIQSLNNNPQLFSNIYFKGKYFNENIDGSVDCNELIKASLLKL